jgi:molybdopterin-dependent oxidoreductase alpha subunit
MPDQDHKTEASLTRVPRAQPPVLPPAESLQVSGPGEVAAGLPSVLSTAKRVVQQSGVVRGVKALLQVNQKDGFDCQGCAWPDPDGDRHAAEFCEQGAKAVTDEATRARITPDFFAQWSVRQLADQPDHWLNQQGRLTHPMVLRDGQDHYEPIAWEAAFRRIAEALNGLDTPDEAAFYTSGRTSNEAAFLFQLFVRQYGTNNLPDCSNLCHESSGVALKEVVGVSKGTVTLDDFERAEAIVVIGQNPGTNHPRMLTSLEQAKRNGATIISINPLP